jgi:hypothetical protein
MNAAWGVEWIRPGKGRNISARPFKGGDVIIQTRVPESAAADEGTADDHPKIRFEDQVDSALGGPNTWCVWDM